MQTSSASLDLQSPLYEGLNSCNDDDLLADLDELCAESDLHLNLWLQYYRRMELSGIPREEQEKFMSMLEDYRCKAEKEIQRNGEIRAAFCKQRMKGN